jgi:ribosome-associated heat shock protein Hsp15
MRLDVFLKASRICPRRTVAQKLCDAGLVSVNGLLAKPAHAIKAGDEITLTRRNKRSVFRVLSVPEERQIAKASASGLYELVDEELLSDLDD